MDVIASTAFGLEINSAKDRNNELVKHAKKFFNGSFWNPVLLAYCKYHDRYHVSCEYFH